MLKEFTYDFTLHLRACDHNTWFCKCLGKPLSTSFGLLQLHGHGSWLMCEVALIINLFFFFKVFWSSLKKLSMLFTQRQILRVLEKSKGCNRGRYCWVVCLVTDSPPTHICVSHQWTSSISIDSIHWLSLTKIGGKSGPLGRSCSLVVHANKCGHVMTLCLPSMGWLIS